MTEPATAALPPDPYTSPFPDGWPTVPSLTVTRDGRVILAAPLMNERQSFDVGPYTLWVTSFGNDRTPNAPDVTGIHKDSTTGGAT